MAQSLRNAEHVPCQSASVLVSSSGAKLACSSSSINQSQNICLRRAVCRPNIVVFIPNAFRPLLALLRAPFSPSIAAFSDLHSPFVRRNAAASPFSAQVATSTLPCCSLHLLMICIRPCRVGIESHGRFSTPCCLLSTPSSRLPPHLYATQEGASPPIFRSSRHLHSAFVMLLTC